MLVVIINFIAHGIFYHDVTVEFHSFIAIYLSFQNAYGDRINE